MIKRKLTAGASQAHDNRQAPASRRTPTYHPAGAAHGSTTVKAKTSLVPRSSGFNYGNAAQAQPSHYPPWENDVGSYRSPEQLARPLLGMHNIPVNFHEYHFRSAYTDFGGVSSQTSTATGGAHGSVSGFSPSSAEFWRMEEEPAPTRNWEHTGLGSILQTRNNDPTLIGGGSRFTIMCYNVLAPSLLENHRELYRKCNGAHLKWDFRVRLFFVEIEKYNPDIVCLQEVETGEFEETFEPRFHALGFRGVFKKKTGDKFDGCAIFYRTSKFLLMDKLEVEYLQPHVPLLNRDNIGLLVKLETRNVVRRQKLVVGTTHLLFNPKREDVKIAQAQLLLAELDRFAFCGFDRYGNTLYHPILMTGDFNCKPNSSVTKLFSESRLQYLDENGDLLKMLRRKGINCVIPCQSGISDQCQHYKILLERYKRWKSHHTNNFEMDLKCQELLVNLFPYLEGRGYFGSTTESEVCMLSPPNEIIPHLSPVNEAPNVVNPGTTYGADNNQLLRQAAEKVAMQVNSTGANTSRTPSTEQLYFPPDQRLHSHLERDVLEDINRWGLKCDFASGVLSHNFNFRDIYSGKLDRPGKDYETVVTSKQSGWTCVDYIYQSMTWHSTFNKMVEGKLKLIRRLGLFTRSDCKKKGDIPNEEHPSDHFPLVAEFLLRN